MGAFLFFFISKKLLVTYAENIYTIMPRIRTIKPEFYRHYELYIAEKESKLPIRTAFSGLWTCADKEGRFKWQPKQLKLDILPYDELNFDDVLSVLLKYDFIIKYTVKGKDYGWIPTFKIHQRITGSEANYDSKIPEYHEGNNMEILSVSKETNNNKQGVSKAEVIDIQVESLSVSKETTWTTGKDGKERNIGKDNKEREWIVPENFLLISVYKSDFKNAKKLFSETTETGFLKWKKFVDFIFKNSFGEIFKFKCINPADFGKLDFPEEKWDDTIRAILGTGIKEEHNLFFRIPQFLEIVDSKKNKNGHKIINGSGRVGKEIVFDKL